MRERSAREADLAYVIALALALALVALGPLQRRIEMIGADDLSRLWTGPHGVLVGAQPYDAATWVAVAATYGAQPFDLAVYSYPPWVLLALVPLGALPLGAASVVWLVGGLAVAAVGLRALLRAYVPRRPAAHATAAIALLLSWVGIETLVIGQWGYLLVGGLCGLVLALRSGRAPAAALLSFTLLAKPQLFVLTTPALAAYALWPGAPRARGRAVAYAAALWIVVVGVSWALFPDWLAAWLPNVAGRQLRPTSDTLAGAGAALFGPAGAWPAAAAVLVLAAIGLRAHPLSDTWLALWTCLGIAAAPYANSYDQLVLIVPIVIGAGAALARSERGGAAVLFGGAAILLVLTPIMYAVAVARHSETFGVLVPVSVFALLAAVLLPGASREARAPLIER